MKIVPKGHRRADDASEVENGPKNANEFALLVLGGIRKHKRTLRRPQKTRADTEVCAGGQNEGANIGVEVICAAGA